MSSRVVCALFLVGALLCGVHAGRTQRFSEQESASFPAQWFDQIIDHYNGETTDTFRQKYYVNDQYFDKQYGPVFMYINGEGPVWGPPQGDTNEVVMLAQKYNAMIVTLEHRFYGQSQPFSDLSTANLRYLSSRQALADWSHFVVNFTNHMLPPPSRPSTHGITIRPVFTIGGSYSGALSAWFRLKFPHISVGAIASSGVVNAILDFTAFDEHVAEAAGHACADALRRVTALAEQAVQAGGAQKDALKTLFSATTLVDDGDFFYFLADSMAEGVQYGFQDQLCNPLVAAVVANASLLPVYANYTQNVWTSSGLGVPAEYATAWQQNITIDSSKADRQWWFQTCTEFGYFQNAPSVGAIRSARVNMTYHRTHCANVFGAPLWPDTESTNEYYGGNHTEATKVIFVNGSQDPWQKASIVTSVSSLEPAIMITCNDCGHCVDLRGCPEPGAKCADQGAVDEARLAISQFVAACLYSF
eukprot:TRINITY_DN3649_c0_g1_i1.p1 TRINITY_DN3649_c0_g1~~TRINITY_DN3649_c0_g1_i1.p1  ORF type:complete len:489 (+),score=142.89 TRINITY_DN3649_c0_g1_i1:46-1467(+)